MERFQSKDYYCDFILNNKIQIEKVKETENVLAFYHTKPNWTTHIVIVPKRHINNFVELGGMDLIKEIFQVVQDIIKEKNLAENNYKIITNGGSFQDSRHLHFHLVSGSEKDKIN